MLVTLRRRHLSRSTATLFSYSAFILGLILTAVGEISAQGDIDSTFIRVPAAPTKSVGDRLLDIPEEVVRFPIRVTKLTVRGGIEAFRANSAVYSLVKNAFSPLPVAGFYPIASIGSNSGYGGGFGYLRPGIFGQEDRLEMEGSYSTHDYQKYRIRYRSFDSHLEHPDIAVRVEYNRKPWESFYGLGNESRKSDQVAYTIEEFFAGGQVIRRLDAAVDLRLAAGYISANLFDGQDPDNIGMLGMIRDRLGLAPSTTRNTRYIRIGGGIGHDWRDHKGQPSKGGIERLSFTCVRGVGRSEGLACFQTELEVHHYINVFMKRILAVRLLARDIDRPADAPSLPLYLRNKLGGEDDLRGYKSARFVDNDMALVSLEWRYPVWRVVDGFVFLDEARVFGSLRDDFSFEDWHYSAGAGLRIWSSQGLHAKTLFAISDEEPQFYLDLGADF